MVTFWPASAFAQQERAFVRLTYVLGDQTGGCPQEAALREAVAARLGYLPFADDAGRLVSVEIVRRGTGHRATIQIREGEATGSRVLDSQGEQCSQLAEALELAIAIAIDPLSIGPEVDPPAEASDPAPPLPQEQPTSTTQEPGSQDAPPVVEQLIQDTEPPRRQRPTVRLSLAGHAELLFAPRPVFGVTLGADLRFAIFSIGVEGRLDIPSHAEALGGRVETYSFLLSAVPCASWRFLYGCVVAGAGVFRASGEGYAAPAQVSTFLATAGGRLGARFRIVGPLELFVQGDILAALTRTTLTVNDELTVWTTPPIALSVGGGASAVF